MAFQPAPVLLAQGAGVPGELYTDGPHISESFIINSASAAYNIIGATAYTVVSQGIAAAGGTGAFAGILVNPKIYALENTPALAPTLVLPNYTQADLLTMGTIFVTLPATAAIGDYVIFDQTTGALSTITPGTSLPSGKSFANALVSYYTVTAAGLGIITLTPQLQNI